MRSLSVAPEIGGRAESFFVIHAVQPDDPPVISTFATEREVREFLGRLPAGYFSYLRIIRGREEASP